MSGTDITVSGGAGGVTAAYDDITTEGQQLVSLSGTLLQLAGTLEGMLVDPDVVASAALDPGGAAAFEGDLVSALDGATGLVAVAAGVGTHGLAVQAAVVTYRATDQALTTLNKAFDYGVGYVAGKTAPIWAPAAVVLAVPVALGVLAGDALTGQDPAKQAQALLAQNSWLVSSALDHLPGFVNGLVSDVGLPPIMPASVPGSAGVLSLLYPDGTPQVTEQSVTASLSAQPRGVQDVLNDAAGAEDVDGVVIRKVTGPDGTGWIVDVAGTHTWNVAPNGQVDPDAVDWTTDVHSLANQQTTYEQGIRQAMAAAGIPSDEPVMIVGHSLGGMVATQTATDLANTYDVTHVVTAGSPVANMTVAPSVQELSLQNNDDVVPQLSGTANPDTPNHVTVTFDSQTNDLAGNHSVSTSYSGAAATVDSSTNASIDAWRQSTGVFFNGTNVTSTQWSVTRPTH